MSATTIAFSGVPEWSEQGPGPIEDANGAFLGTGAVVALAAHPTQSGAVYAATSGGGVWRSLNAGFGATTPDWQPLTDQYPSTALGAITLSHRDPSTVYAGTGTFASFEPSGAAVGLYHSRDGGDHWQVTGADTLYGLPIRSLATTPVPASGTEALLVAALDGYRNGKHGGIFRSEDGGATLTALSGAAGSRLPAGAGWALVADPALPGRVYTAITVPGAGGAIFRSDDGGATWTPSFIGSVDSRLLTAMWIRLAVAADRVYVGVVGPATPDPQTMQPRSGTQLVGLFTANSGGAQEQWSEIPLPGGTPDVLIPGLQGTWKFAMTATAGSLYVGGDEGGIWRCDLANPSSPRWERLSQLGGVTGDSVPPDADTLQRLAVHDDCQDLVIDAAGDLLAATDGGVYRLVNPARESAPQRGVRGWYAIATTMRNTEAFSVGYDTLNRIVVAGAADNGCGEQQHPGSRTWTQPPNLDGDGGGQSVDNSDPNVTLRYAMGNTEGDSLQNIYRRTFDHTNRLKKTDAIMLAAPATPTKKGSALTVGNDANQGGSFVRNNLAGHGARMLVAGTQGLYESHNDGATARVIPLTNSSGTAHTGVWAIAYGAMQDGVPLPDVAWLGLGDGTVWVRPQGGPFRQVPSPPGASGPVSAVVVDVRDWRRAYVLYNTQLWLTENAGGLTGNNTPNMNWLDCTGNLLAVAADAQNGAQLETIQLIPHDAGGEVVLVCAAGGVFRSLNARAGTGARWTRFGRNLPATYAHDVQYYPASVRRNGPAGDVMVASLYGRGAWVLEQASRDLFSPAAMEITTPAGPTTIRLVRGSTLPALLEVFDQDGFAGPVATVPLTALSRIRVTMRGARDRLILDCSNGLIALADGIDVVGHSADASLILTGGRANEQRIVIGQASHGIVRVDGMQVRYEGMGSITSAIATGETVIESETTPATRALANGDPVNDTPGVRLVEATGNRQFTVAVTRATGVTLDLRNGGGRLDIDGLVRPPRGLARLTVRTGRDAQDVRITATPPGVPVMIQGGGGAGSVAIGSITGSGGSLAAVQGPVQVHNPGGATQLTVSAALDPAATTAMLATGSLSGLGPAAISFAPSDLAGLTVLGSAGGTAFTVEDTLPAGTTALFGGAASNALEIHGTSGPLDYTTGNGADRVSLGVPSPNGSRVGQIWGPVNIQCLPQANVNVTVDDRGETAAKDVGITTAGILGMTTAAITLAGGATPANSLRIRSGHGRGFYSITDTPPTFTVSLDGQGSDIVNVYATQLSLAIDGATAVTLGDQLTGLTRIKDDVHIGANPGGTTQLTLDDRGNPHPMSVEFDRGTVRGLIPGVLDFSAATLRDLSVLCGNGGDAVRVANTPASVSTFIGLGTAPNHVDVLAISGPLIINAPAGALHKVIVGSTAPDVQRDDLSTIKALPRIV